MTVVVPKPVPLSGLDIAGGVVDMTHGGGGRAGTDIVAAIFRRHFDNPVLAEAADHARLPRPAGRLVVSTDSHVVSPLFFPGGDIGGLAVNGTVNDVAMAGAVPEWLAAAFIVEEGLPLATLDRIAASMAEAARAAGVAIVTGDTKVVEKGKGDGVFITTTGVGTVPDGIDIAPARIAPGDRILVSGTIGEHGVAILSKRENLAFETEILSDTAPLGGLVAAMVAAVPGLHALRDPTRGGLSAALNELAHHRGLAMALDEAAIPVSDGVAAAAELLGLDPLNIACEGRLVAFVAAAEADRLLAAMRAHHLGGAAAIVGTVGDGSPALVTMQTRLGGSRIVDWLNGEQLPRIC